MYFYKTKMNYLSLNIRLHFTIQYYTKQNTKLIKIKYA